MGGASLGRTDPGAAFGLVEASMRNMIKSTVAAAIFSSAAVFLAPGAASAGVIGLSDQQATTPAPAIEKACYFHRHYRHWGYHRHYRRW